MGNYIKIAYFPSTSSREQVLGSNGKNITNYCTRCETTEETNNYIVDMTFTLEASEYLEATRRAISKPFKSGSIKSSKIASKSWERASSKPLRPLFSTTVS